ncbi:MAG TPA: AsmA-like C-terminal region-containing protein [Gemmataceae bacterium]|jgi:hypothetical protein|nr:AsmA-like C-terminal region-containing protein [Gemmataceae bacterium]
MVWRKWLVRFLVFSVAGCAIVAAAIYQHFTNPAAVRQQVIDRLKEHLPGADVRVEYACIHLMGGITFQDLHLFRRDDPKQTIFLEVPSGTIFHDKEKLLDGSVVIRKIEFDKPWLRVVREKNGDWNLTGILGAVDLSKPIPTIVLKQATIFLEDKKVSPPVAPLQIKDVNLAIVNDPRETLTFKGSGVCSLIGVIEISGSLGRANDQFNLSLHMPEMNIGGDLVQRLAGYHPEAADHLRMLTGKCKDLQADLFYDPQTKPAWSYSLRGKLTDGRFGHAQLPMTLEQVEGDVSLINGLLDLKKLTAHFGESRVEMSGKLVPGEDGYDLEKGCLTVSRLNIDEALMEHLPQPVDDLNKMFRPRGPISFYIEASRLSGRWHTRALFKPEEMRAACQRFPYKLERIQGTVEQDSDPEHGAGSIKIDLVGYSGAHAVSVRGKMGEKGPGSVAVHVTARDLPLDDKMRLALLPQYQTIVDSFQPKGQVDVDVDIVRPPGVKEFQNQIIARFHDTSVSYAIFPYPIEMVSGTLEILPDHWEFHDFVGVHKKGVFRAKGGSMPAPGGKGHELKILLDGERIQLDEEMVRALKQPALQQTWSSLRPSGHIRFFAEVTQKDDQAPDIRVQVTPQEGCRINPAVFPYAMYVSFGPRGSVEYRDHHVYLDQIICQHGPTVLTLKEGNVTCKLNGGFSIDLGELVGNPVVPDAELVAALPGALGTAIKTMELREALSLRLPELTVDVPNEGGAPYIYWRGAIGLQNAFIRLGVPLENVSGNVYCSGQYQGQLGAVDGNVEIRQARLFNQPIEKLNTHFTVNGEQPGMILLPNLEAQLFGGAVGGIVKIKADDTLKYELKLNATQVQLEAFGRHNQIGTKTQLSGLAAASLFLEGSGTNLNSLRGNGSVDIPNGKIYNLPPIVSLLKVLKLRVPDDTAFEEAHMQFGINGRKVEFNRLDLYGDAVSLGGKGSMQLDGSQLMVDFYALIGPFNSRMLPVLGSMEAFISKRILKIKMRGSLQDVECDREAVPGVVEPVKEFLNRIRGSSQ